MDTSDFEFMKFLSKYGKSYDTVEEFVARKELYLLKDVIIKAHNARPSNFSMGHNKFSDYNQEEMNKLLGEKEFEESSNAYC